MRKIFGILLALLSLSLAACQSIGMQYDSPSAGEKSAELKGVDGSFINNTNAKGCYYGRTDLSDPVRVHVGKPLVVGYETTFYEYGHGFWASGTRFTCSQLFRFTPAENARYRIWADQSVEVGSRAVCHIGLLQMMNDGTEKSVPIEDLYLHRVKWNCIQFQSGAERDAEEQAEAEADAREEAEDAARDAAEAKAKAEAKDKAQEEVRGRIKYPSH
jgi:hypothetical protein